MELFHIVRFILYTVDDQISFQQSLMYIYKVEQYKLHLMICPSLFLIRPVDYLHSDRV